jgi:hypothetical protein
LRRVEATIEAARNAPAILNPTMAAWAMQQLEREKERAFSREERQKDLQEMIERGRRLGCEDPEFKNPSSDGRPRRGNNSHSYH